MEESEEKDEGGRAKIGGKEGREKEKAYWHKILINKLE